MGVRQAVWRQKLWAEPDMRIVSAGVEDAACSARPPPSPFAQARDTALPPPPLLWPGIPDYLTAVPRAHFCLHTEGNGWGARVVDHMAVEPQP